MFKFDNSERIGLVSNEMKKLVLFRGTMEEIVAKVNEIKIREDDVVLEPFEEFAPITDFGFNTNLGQIGDKYLDFEIYMLPTNKRGNFVITKVLAF